MYFNTIHVVQFLMLHSPEILDVDRDTETQRHREIDWRERNLIRLQCTPWSVVSGPPSGHLSAHSVDHALRLKAVASHAPPSVCHSSLSTPST